jgi:hypothetical protein
MTDNRKSVYIETTIPSYATSKANRDIIKAHHGLWTPQLWTPEVLMQVEEEEKENEVC